MGKTYEIRIAPAAIRQLRKLPSSVQSRVISCFESLSENPRPPGVEKLSQYPRFWRVRCGEYRIVYCIDDKTRIVVALIVRHRKDAYRDLDKLDPAVIAKSLTPLLAELSVAS
jgi:mRNA interferase RelE/StbE